MKSQSQIRLAWWIDFPLCMIALRFAAGGRVWAYLIDHVWLAAVLPLIALFLLLFMRGMQYRRAQGGNAKIEGAHGVKP